MLPINISADNEVSQDPDQLFEDFDNSESNVNPSETHNTTQRTDENNRPEPDENNVIQNDTDKVLLKDYDSPSGKYNSYDRNHPLYISQYIWHFILYSYNQ